MKQTTRLLMMLLALALCSATPALADIGKDDDDAANDDDSSQSDDDDAASDDDDAASDDDDAASDDDDAASDDDDSSAGDDACGCDLPGDMPGRNVLAAFGSLGLALVAVLLIGRRRSEA